MSAAIRRFGLPISVAFLALCGACDTVLVSAPTANHNVADFEAAWAWMDTVYPAFHFKGIDWDSIHAVYRPLAEAARGDEILQVLRDLLAVPQDGHLYFQTAGGGLLYPYLPSRLLRDRDTFSPILVRAYMDAPLQRTGGGVVEYGSAGGGVGYVRIASFDPGALRQGIEEALDSVRHSNGLIMDVRNNNGGDQENVAAVVSHFITATLLWPQAVEVDGVPFQPWDPIEPDRSHYTYGGPIVVLINGASVSAAEIFAETMKQIPTVTVVGETTAGAACNDREVTPGEHTLPSGILIHIPTGCLLRYDGQPMEWNGVPPDIAVEQTADDIARGHDPQLEYALTLLR